VLIAAALRLAHLLENRFHPDEAHYAAFARLIASGPGHGILLSHIVVDKPPLAFYVNAISVAVLGGHEFALRLPSLFFSVISVALVYRLARRLYGPTAGVVAAWAMTLSPFAIQFAITIFVDPLLTTLLLAGMVLMLARRTGWAAVALGLAFATKQTALLFIPLALLLGLMGLPRPVRFRQAAVFLLRAALPTLAALALIVMAVLAWDHQRGAPIGTWSQGYSDNAPTRLVTPDELKLRSEALLALLHQFTGSTVVDLLFLAGLVFLVGVDLRQRAPRATADGLLLGFSLVYLGAYWLLSFNLFDRYLLPLLPLVFVLLGRVAAVSVVALRDGGNRMAGLVRLARYAGQLRPPAGAWRALAAFAPIILVLFLIRNAVATNYDFSPIGGDHGALDGIDDTARFVHTLPRNGVLYDHWLSWEFEYYLFDRPMPTYWFPDTPTLVANLTASGHARPHYVAVPWWASAAEVDSATARAGYRLVPVHKSFRRDGVPSIVIYQLQPQSERNRRHLGR
jgi:4-amino-4-deoxy-L-arabinose transferase-like glycosyltransferase